MKPSNFYPARRVRSALCIAAALALPSPLLAQKATEPFGQEKVETREFRNKEAEKAMNTKAKSGHNHGKKSHKGHAH